MSTLRFTFPLWNHSQASQETNIDLHAPILAALAALGYVNEAAMHDPRAVRQESDDAMSIYTECFMREEADKVLERNRPFGLLCTEYFDGDKLIGCSDRRTDSFKRLAQRASFIWSVCEQPHYRDFGVPYARIPFAWEPLCYRPKATEPDYDLCVFGLMTKSRVALKAKMERDQVSHAWVPYGATRDARDDIIARARFVLGLTATGAPEEISGTRITAALYAGRPILPMEEVVRLDEVRQHWRDRLDEQLSAWQSRPSMRDVLAQAIADTISL